MKKSILFLLTAFTIAQIACNSNPPEQQLNKDEEKAVIDQMEADKKSQDSMSAVIEAQINGTDTAVTTQK